VIREALSRLGKRIANILQPQVARELQAERPDIHEARRRVHILVLLAELARMRRFPTHREQPR
jgi:hypothetical protein